MKNLENIESEKGRVVNINQKFFPFDSKEKSSYKTKAIADIDPPEDLDFSDFSSRIILSIENLKIPIKVTADKSVVDAPYIINNCFGIQSSRGELNQLKINAASNDGTNRFYFPQETLNLLEKLRLEVTTPMIIGRFKSKPWNPALTGGSLWFTEFEYEEAEKVSDEELYVKVEERRKRMRMKGSMLEKDTLRLLGKIKMKFTLDGKSQTNKDVNKQQE